MARPPSGRPRRRWLLWTIVAVVAAVLLFGAISGFYIDVLWFREVGYSSVFWKRLWTRVLLAAVFGAAFFVVVYVNLLIVRRLRPRYRAFAGEEDPVERYRTAIEPYARWLLPGLSLLLALFAAIGVASQWEQFLLWTASGEVSFGVTDPLPQFGRDVSFYLLSLPFQQFVQSWVFTSLVVITVATAGAHYLWGGISLRAIGERVSPQVKAHLSVLLGLIMLVKAWGYRLGQFDLLVSERGAVTGASYTDVNAHLPALRLLVIIAIVSAVLFLVNIRFRGWALPIASIGLLALTSVVAGAIYPAIVQRFQVAPQELQREEPFIDRNIEFSRRAFGIEDVATQSFAAQPEVTPDEIRASGNTMSNLRLWNPEVLARAYLQLQRIRQYYEFHDVDVDRYEIDGERRLVMISPREINQVGIPAGGATWQNQHLFYTHGFGAAASRVEQVTPEGAPAFVLSNIPVTGALAEELAQPRIYFQERTVVPYVLVRSGTPEFDFPLGEEGEEELVTYDGTGGIDIGGFFERLAFAWRFRDVNLVLSDLVDDDTRIMINTELRERVERLAPFLQYDHDPYVAIVDGRLKWIWDAYTTADTFPYSQRVDLAQVTGGALDGQANYIRNSVKVVIDAYDGTTTFYALGDDDPMIQAWERVFPDLFTPVEEAPAALVEHFRYPEDLFRVQAHQYANYHVTDASQFYAKEDFWSVPQVVKQPGASPIELEPYYVLLPLPTPDEPVTGEEETAREEFLLFIPFTPADRPNMVAWLAAKSDPGEYGELVSFEFQAENITGPGQATALIRNDTEVAEQTTLFGQVGSEVIYGDILAIPIGSSFLYVQPLYLQAEQEGAIPELKRVVVVNGERVSIEPTLQEALTASFGIEEPPDEDGQPPVPPEDGQPPVPPEDEEVADLLARAEQHFEDAQLALEDGDLATYAREVELARRLVQRAAELADAPTG